MKLYYIVYSRKEFNVINLYKINVNVVEIKFNSTLCGKGKKLVILVAGDVLGEGHISPKTEIFFSKEPLH